MTEGPFDERDEAPTIEVRVFRHGVLVQRELCESEEQAARVADAWSEMDGVCCEVDDLSIHHRLGDVAEPEPAEVRDDERAEVVEQAQSEARALRYD